MICSVAVIVEEAFLSNARSHSSLRFLDECAGRFKSLHIASQWAVNASQSYAKRS